MSFVETIKILDGDAPYIAYHQERMNRTIAHFFPNVVCTPLDEISNGFRRPGLNKLRVVYGPTGIEKVECSPYAMRNVKTLKVIEGGDIDYGFKSTDRTCLNQLTALKGECDDIVITRHGLVTDTSFTNIAIFDGHVWLTPKSPLLCGTKRAFLLKHRLIEEADITVGDLMAASHVRLFNAMIEFGEMEIEPEGVVV